MRVISDDIVNVGLRPGEKLNEKLISAKEVSCTFVEEKYITIKNHENPDGNRLTEEYTSENAEFMTEEEMILTVAEADESLRKTPWIKNY